MQMPHPLPSQPPPGFSGQVAVVGPQFCAPYPVDLTITQKAISITDGDFVITDTNGSIVFKVKGIFFSLRDRCVLLDAAGNPLLSMQQKIMSAHRRWLVFSGDSSDKKDLLFTVRKSSCSNSTPNWMFSWPPTPVRRKLAILRLKEAIWRDHALFMLEIPMPLLPDEHDTQDGECDAGKGHVRGDLSDVDYAFISYLIIVPDEINKDRDY